MMSRQQLARTYQPISTSLQQIQELKERDDIVIKPADKGSAVVMDNVEYLEEANTQLTDERFYKKLDSDPTEEFSTKITQELTIMKENSRFPPSTSCRSATLTFERHH
jgi:hypothetical protein